MKRIHVDDVETLPVLRRTLMWKPVRRALGITAFGINAYHGAKAGDPVVEEHADPHQELYSLACIEEAEGNRVRAVETLRAAVARHPAVREWAEGEERLVPVLREL